MNKYIMVFEYNLERFMDLDKIILFKKNLETIQQGGNLVNLVFYGNADNEEFSTFMGYFNRLLQKKICKISISFKTNEMVIEKGINNKSIKLSSRSAKEIINKNFNSVIQEYYNDEEIKIKVFPNTDWEKAVLNL